MKSKMKERNTLDNMEDEKKIKGTRGGRRAGAGRKPTIYKKSINVRVSEEAYGIYVKMENKSEVIDRLIKAAEGYGIC